MYYICGGQLFVNRNLLSGLIMNELLLYTRRHMFMGAGYTS